MLAEAATVPSSHLPELLVFVIWSAESPAYRI